MTQPPSNPPAGQETPRWEWPINTVGRLIANLQTLPSEMPFYTVYFVDIGDERVAKARHPSMSKETVAAGRIQKYSDDDQSLVMWANQDERELAAAKAQLAEATVQSDNAISLLSEVYELLRSTGGLSCERRSPADVIYRRVNAFLKPKADHG